MSNPTIKQYDLNGVAGLVKQAHSKLTGHLYSVYNAEQALMDPAGGRWVVKCEDHSTLTNLGSLELATKHMPTGDWCEDCMRELEARAAFDGAMAPQDYIDSAEASQDIDGTDEVADEAPALPADAQALVDRFGAEMDLVINARMAGFDGSIEELLPYEIDITETAPEAPEVTEDAPEADAEDMPEADAEDVPEAAPAAPASAPTAPKGVQVRSATGKAPAALGRVLTQNRIEVLSVMSDGIERTRAEIMGLRGKIGAGEPEVTAQMLHQLGLLARFTTGDSVTFQYVPSFAREHAEPALLAAALERVPALANVTEE